MAIKKKVVSNVNVGVTFGSKMTDKIKLVKGEAVDVLFEDLSYLNNTINSGLVSLASSDAVNGPSLKGVKTDPAKAKIRMLPTDEIAVVDSVGEVVALGREGVIGSLMSMNGEALESAIAIVDAKIAKTKKVDASKVDVESIKVVDVKDIPAEADISAEGVELVGGEEDIAKVEEKIEEVIEEDKEDPAVDVIPEGDSPEPYKFFKVVIKGTNNVIADFDAKKDADDHILALEKDAAEKGTPINIERTQRKIEKV